MESERDDGLAEAGEEGAEAIEKSPEIAVDRETVTEMPNEAPFASKKTIRQLSKKELKKKGLEELEAVLAEFCYMNRGKSSEDETRKKKNDMSLRKVKEVQEQLGGIEFGARTDETTEAENFEDNSTIDMKERLKKLTSTKKKKSCKEMDSAARAAAAEAAPRQRKRRRITVSASAVN
ncbi:uncharacterized protein J3R85_014818 [Psidium guajava]|nr:uncharacterized protein J3R85_014818 [Psidium guajava]